VIAAAAAVVGASLLIAALRHHPIEVVAGSPSGSAIGADVAEAAVWRSDSFPVGASGALSKKEAARFDKQKERVRGVARDLTDAITVVPATLPKAASRLMTRAAAKALVAHASSLPKAAELVTVLKRTGHIGIQAPRFSAAAARMKVTMQASFDERIVRWREDFTFWIQRSKGAWKVIAFDLDRTQL
jgi:hypothetical protein